MIFPRIPNGSDILDKVSSMKLICNYYIRNYGSVLQSYASFIAIKKFDSRVTVINYVDRPDNMAKAEIAIRIKTKYLLNFSMLINKIRKIICGDDEYEYIVSKRGIEFDSFIQKSFIFTQQYNSPLEIAVNLQEKAIVVIGSDQLWGPEDIIRDYHTLNWVPTDHKTVSYATSFGVSELPKFVCERAKRFLKKITCISVRESAGVKIVNDLISRVVPQVCDPTLLLKKQEWESIASDRMINEPYIFCFFIGDNPWQREKAIKLRETTGYKIVAILHLDQYIPSDNGYAEIAYSLLLRKEYPSWLYSVGKGATTIWEHWDGIMENGDFWSTDMNSFNHYAYGSVAEWIYEKAAGIQAIESEPGYRKVIIAPLPDKRLGWLRVRLDTRNGKIVSCWRCEKDSVRYEISVDMPAVIIIDGRPVKVNSGKYIFWGKSAEYTDERKTEK